MRILWFGYSHSDLLLSSILQLWQPSIREQTLALELADDLRLREHLTASCAHRRCSREPSIYAYARRRANGGPRQTAQQAAQQPNEHLYLRCATQRFDRDSRWFDPRAAYRHGGWRDADHDGVRNRFDRAPHNPYRY